MPNIDIDSFYKEIGSLIRVERIKSGINQEILGNQLSLTRASIINLEKGRHRPSIYQLIQIAEILQTDILNLIPIENPKIAKTKKEILDNLDNAITDQDSINTSQRTAVIGFLTSIKK